MYRSRFEFRSRQILLHYFYFKQTCLAHLFNSNIIITGEPTHSPLKEGIRSKFSSEYASQLSVTGRKLKWPCIIVCFFPAMFSWLQFSWLHSVTNEEKHLCNHNGKYRRFPLQNMGKPSCATTNRHLELSRREIGHKGGQR